MNAKVPVQKFVQEFSVFVSSCRMKEIDLTWCELLHPTPVIRGYGGATFAGDAQKRGMKRI
jgi:hypothetical protein